MSSCRTTEPLSLLCTRLAHRASLSTLLTAYLYTYLTSTNSSTLSAIYSKVLVHAGTYPHLELMVLVDVHGGRENMLIHLYDAPFLTSENQPLPDLTVLQCSPTNMTFSIQAEPTLNREVHALNFDSACKSLNGSIVSSRI